MNLGINDKTFRIWKTTLLPGKNEVLMPIGAKPLSVDIQHGSIVMWFEVRCMNDGTAYEEKSKYLIYGFETGQRYFSKTTDVYLGTVLLKDQNYVLHFYWLGGKGFKP